MTSTEGSFDYVICGGGLVGCVLASRLSQAGYSIALLEAGPEDYSELVMRPGNLPRLLQTPLLYHYMTTPQKGLGGRQIPAFGGRLLSGSSAVNYFNWTRGHSADYDAWAELVEDDRWNYANMLKYFKKIETHHDEKGDRRAFGFDGPIFTIKGGSRNYPLKDTIREVLVQAGLDEIPNANSGSPFGFSPFTENLKNNLRQPAGKAYDLSKVKIFTNSIVARICIDSDSRTATGAILTDGRSFLASKEVIVSCGAIKTPQLLMLSGIGPSEHLSLHNIPTVVDLPVGENFHDHASSIIYWKLREPELGLAVGSPLFNKPEYFQGNPVDWIVTASAPQDELEKAAKVDKLSPDDPYLRSPRGHIEMFVAYVPVAADKSIGFQVPVDGGHISTALCLLLSTSRGRVTLASTDPTDDPIIDPNYMGTETDKVAMREAMKLALRTFETPSGQSLVEGETPPPGMPALTSNSNDEDIDERVRRVGGSFIQNAGTASMGKVVDTECKVKGVQNLRVVDASILPAPIAGHYQSVCYAIGEAVSDIILGKA